MQGCLILNKLQNLLLSGSFKHSGQQVARWPLLGTARPRVTGHASPTRGEPRLMVSGPGIAGMLAKWKDLWTGSQAGVLVPSPSSPHQFAV